MKTVLKILVGILVSMISLVLSIVFIYPQPGGGMDLSDSFFKSLIYFFPWLLFAVFILVFLSRQTESIRNFYSKKTTLYTVLALSLIWGYLSWNFKLTNDALDIFYWIILISTAMILYFRVERLLIKNRRDK